MDALELYFRRNVGYRRGGGEYEGYSITEALVHAHTYTYTYTDTKT